MSHLCATTGLSVVNLALHTLCLQNDRCGSWVGEDWRKLPLYMVLVTLAHSSAAAGYESEVRNVKVGQFSVMFSVALSLMSAA